MVDIRRLARGIALQILYELDTTGHSEKEITTFREPSTIKWDDARSKAYLALRAYYDDTLHVEDDEDLDTSRFEETPLFSLEEQKFAYRLVEGVFANRERLDKLIQRFSPEWPVDQIATIDRNILRIALYEFGVSRDTPIKVAINEAVELAKAFGSDNAPSFVNGVLGSLADHHREIFAENESET